MASAYLRNLDLPDAPAEQAAAITDASVAHALADTFDDEESEAALDALGGKVNSILAVLRSNGLIAS